MLEVRGVGGRISPLPRQQVERGWPCHSPLDSPCSPRECFGRRPRSRQNALTTELHQHHSFPLSPQVAQQPQAAQRRQCLVNHHESRNRHQRAASCLPPRGCRGPAPAPPNSRTHARSATPAHRPDPLASPSWRPTHSTRTRLAHSRQTHRASQGCSSVPRDSRKTNNTRRVAGHVATPGTG